MTVKIKIELTWLGGILAEDQSERFPEPNYNVIDADTDRLLNEQTLQTYDQVEAFVAEFWPDCTRWTSTESSEESPELLRVLEVIEKSNSIVPFDPRAAKLFLISELYEVGYFEPTALRIHAALRKLSLLS